MGTIQDKLSVLASTTESAESGLTNDQLDEEKKKVSVVDYKMVTFSLCGKDYAIDIMKVKEIAKAGRFTYVPNTLPFVLGVYNLRGDIIPIIDLRLFFNIEIPEREDNSLENMLIVTVGEQTFGVVVDAIDKVVGIQKSTIQPPHPLFGDINIKYIYGVVEAERHLYILLDIDKIFGLRSPSEEREMAETAKAQMKKRQAAAIAIEKSHEETQTPAKAAETAVQKKEVDLNFIADSLKNFKKFFLTDVNKEWVKERYSEWEKTRGADKTQLQSDADAELFLAPFYSKCTGNWWTEEYAESVAKALPDNSAKNIVVWNPGCGKGYESYSLACLLKKRYPEAKIKVYGHDVDLLSVSNAPLMNLTDQASSDWYQPYTVQSVGGDYTFSKEIKDSVMFEYHDCVHTNNLPPIDIIFARDILSFLPEDSQKTVLTDFNEKMKGNGVIIVGDNENIAIPGWNKKQAGNVAVYSK
ncbi:CheR family methyltransferase [Treponema sp.]|uniref:CheR family methyltransferase n=1 Tax=Treponema sp. TaxID=166 RepID=UPI0025D116E7|nr:CheR family methyltransferase [Treponema sp.]MCR5218807.1 chemotaxis protein CheW [Treponema sp.]